MDRKQYIENNEFSDSLNIYLERLNIKREKEIINVKESLGRITASPCFAKISDPFYNAAAMDGIKVNSIDTLTASISTPKVLVKGKDFEYVNTGGEMNSFDSCVMIEEVTILSPFEVSIISPINPWSNVRIVGESVSSGEMILNSNHLISAVDIGALIASGNEKIEVYKKLIIGIIPTGSEIVESVEEVKSGKIIESNSYVISAKITETGNIAKRYGVVCDDMEKIEEAIRSGVNQCDILLVNAGSSAGEKDYTVKVIEKLGEVVFHGLSIKPGKPTILGIVNDKAVIGLPGYPLSCNIVFDYVVRKIIDKHQGTNFEREKISCTLTKKIPSSVKAEEFVPLSCGVVDNNFVATPIGKGASNVLSLVRGDGILRIPRKCEGIDVGERVEVELIKPKKVVEKALVITGSHDIIIDIMSEKMNITSSHVGSYNGLITLKNKGCVIAPTHILDEKTSVYNIPIIEKLFGKGKMALIRGVKRSQGFYFFDKNFTPKISDLTKMSFANRQKGSGTRILLDYLLEKNGIDKSKIKGYETELNNHLQVAGAVKSGAFSLGLGIYSVAKECGLGFSFVANENYDFCVYKDSLNDERVKEFISTLKSIDFRESVEKIGGYSFENTGEIIEI